MRIVLKYFTGTGNSLKVMRTCQEVFERTGNKVELSAIEMGEKLPQNADLIGFCFPVYAFDIPRICTQYLKQLTSFKAKQKSFVLITAGDADESGFSVQTVVKLLQSKNCETLHSEVVEMPANWTTGMNPPSPEEATQILQRGDAHAHEIAQNIMQKQYRLHQFNFPKRFSKFGFYREYYLFKYLGIKNLWRSFKVYDSCNGCGLCSRICPVNSIKMKNKQPQWSAACEQCMRCVNFCPRRAIYQGFGGETKDRNRYFEPSFKPSLK